MSSTPRIMNIQSGDSNQTNARKLTRQTPPVVSKGDMAPTNHRERYAISSINQLVNPYPSVPWSLAARLPEYYAWGRYPVCFRESTGLKSIRYNGSRSSAHACIFSTSQSLCLITCSLPRFGVFIWIVVIIYAISLGRRYLCDR